MELVPIFLELIPVFLELVPVYLEFLPFFGVGTYFFGVNTCFFGVGTCLLGVFTFFWSWYLFFWSCYLFFWSCYLFFWSWYLFIWSWYLPSFVSLFFSALPGAGEIVFFFGFVHFPGAGQAFFARIFRFWELDKQVKQGSDGCASLVVLKQHLFGLFDLRVAVEWRDALGQSRESLRSQEMAPGSNAPHLRRKISESPRNVGDAPIVFRPTCQPVHRGTLPLVSKVK